MKKLNDILTLASWVGAIIVIPASLYFNELDWTIIGLIILINSGNKLKKYEE